MKDSDRFKLYFGPYKTPRFKYGKKVWCEYRGWVKIVGLSDGKIQWPIGRPMTPNPGRDSLIIYQGLRVEPRCCSLVGRIRHNSVAMA